jgi:hypothetical protein
LSFFHSGEALLSDDLLASSGVRNHGDMNRKRGGRLRVECMVHFEFLMQGLTGSGQGAVAWVLGEMESQSFGAEGHVDENMEMNRYVIERIVWRGVCGCS